MRPIRLFARALGAMVLAMLAACSASNADTAMQHPLPPSERQRLEQRFAGMSAAELKDLILQPGGLEEKRIAVHVLASRTQAADTLPALHQALHALSGGDFMDSTLRAEIRVAIAIVEAHGVRPKQIVLLSALLAPGSEHGTVAAAALALREMGGEDAAAALRANERKDAPMVRLARYHIELDARSPGEAARQVLADVRALASGNQSAWPFVAEGSYLNSRGKWVLPVLERELAGIEARRQADGQSAGEYERFLREVVGAIKQQTVPVPATKAHDDQDA